jgi:hypothetical protein
MKETLKTLVDCTDLPLSVIIIGVGSDQFKSMYALDGISEL